MASYLVTGGAGFIGSNLVEELLKGGHRIKVLDNFSTGKKANLQPFLADLELIEGDIADYRKVKKACRGMEYVLHLAALPSVPRSVEDPALCHRSNLSGTFNVLLGAKQSGVKRLVLASSSAVYGAANDLPNREDSAWQALSPYALSKLAGELYCALYSALYRLETVCLRFFNVFGPRQDPSSPYSGVISRFIEVISRGEAPEIFGDGLQTRDFVYVDNVVLAIIRACESKRCGLGECINIGTGKSTSINDLVSSLNSLLGGQLGPRYAPPRMGEIRHSLADINKAQELLGYQVIVDFQEGLARTLSSFKIK
ncbi:MAG: SDR family oxidoreductase [Clostridia bacterium]|nr:SDR family oxidoreductase [Clostridia bacterium]